MAKTDPQKSKLADSQKFSGHAFLAIVFILFGSVLLLNNFGVLPWSVWAFLCRFWPVFLILAGIQILFGKTWLANTLIFALGFGIVAALIIISISSTNAQFADKLDIRFPWLAGIRQRLPLAHGNTVTETLFIREIGFIGVERIEADLRLGAGRFIISDSGTPHFLEVKASYFENFGKPEISSRQDNSTLKIKLDSQQGLGLIGGSEETSYEIGFGKTDTPTSIFANVGAGSIDANLENLKIEEFEMKIGAGKVNVQISEVSYPKGKIKIDVGAGNFDLKLPYNSFIKINYNVGVGNLTVDGTKLGRSGTFTTSNFNIKEDPKVIEVNIGAGNVNISTAGN